MTYFLFVLGFVLLVKGADLLVDGASAIAKRFRISELVIGLTIVSMATSAPELTVNIMANIEGAGDIGIGNVLGSNTANILLILGLSAFLYPLQVKSSTVWKEIPFSFLCALVFFFIANDALLDGTPSMLGRAEGLVLIAFWIVFMVYVFGMAKNDKAKGESIKKYSLLKSLGMTFFGTAALILGGRWVVDGAVSVANFLGFSQVLIGFTVVAVGTSLPELATSVMAAYKKNSDIAIGTVIGSNIFNILWVLGLSIIVHPIPFDPATNIDVFMVLFSTILLFAYIFIGKKGELSRFEGASFLLCYLSYIVFLVMRG